MDAESPMQSKSQEASQEKVNLTAILNRSGFPFQNAVATMIEKSARWQLHATEFPWTDHRDQDQFLDVLAFDQQHFLAIECKRYRDESLIFLGPTEITTTTETPLASCTQIAPQSEIAGCVHAEVCQRQVNPSAPTSVRHSRT